MPGQTFHDEHPYRNDIDAKPSIPKRLILCFDGTGNSFQGNTSDTNIVKLLDMFDRSAPRQMHYYQPGIGTYSMHGSVNRSFFGRLKDSISQTVDSGLATSFDSHVMAGYRFLMRYYGVGDPIYIFGFSRGAFTARFLARMISHVGLLSMGNEEMVPFAYKVYQDYEMGVANAGPYMATFRSTFCRHEVDETSTSKDPDVGIKVHFLGLFDTVNSVGTFDVPFTATPKVPNVNGTAEHVRHAVAIDERRVKFKAALLAQDQRSESAPAENHKEVWFPGSHCDIGGGWPAENERPKEPLNLWQRFKRLLFRAKAPNEASLDKSSDWFQLSDIPLKWMIDELDSLPTDRLHWNEENKQDFLARFARSRSKAIKARMHDSMAFGGGSSFGKTMMWKLMEWLPFIKRWEYYPETGWRYVRLPLNKGATRDIPPGARFHHSVIERLQGFSDSYRPKNDISVRNHSCHLSDAVSRVIEYGDTPPKKGPFFVHHDQQDDDKETDRIYELEYN